MKKTVLHIILLCSFYSTFTFTQPWYFADDFENYMVWQQLACQNPIDWTTWSNSPCGFEDPYITNLNAFNGQNSVKIDYWSDLIKPLGDYTTTYRVSNIGFYFYIPSNHTGYFALLSKFTPDPYEWGAECYFDLGENGRLVLGSSEIINFNYQYDEWQYVELDIDLDNDFAQFSINNFQIHEWQWSQNGTISNQLAAQNFWGEGVLNEMYIDNYTLNDNWLSDPPNTPSNLIVQQIFNPQPQVQLNWQDNSWNEYAFKIIRKNGLPNSTNSYTIIDTVFSNTTQYIDSTVLVDSTYTYGIIAFNIYGNSDTSNTASITILPIPVELVSFTSEVINNNVTLNWSTATEANNRGFEILRFAQNDDKEWQKIGFVNGHGTTTEPQFYSFTDESLQPGKYQYRLKQIDLDGSFEYSKVVEVTVQAPTEFSLSQNYPNPFNPTTKIKFTLPSPYQGEGPGVRSMMTTLKVYDILGNEVATLVNEEKPAGEYEVAFNGSNLSSGIYFYQLKAGNYFETKKMVVMK